MKPGMKPRPMIDRFNEKWIGDCNSECWLWVGYVRPDGYGEMGGGPGEVLRAHRFSYEHFVGPIPAGLTIDHLCRVRSCVNPKHLEPVTQRENNRRGFSIYATNARKTHCKNGHPFDEANTRWHRSNGITCRRCGTCHDAYMKAYRSANV